MSSRYVAASLYRKRLWPFVKLCRSSAEGGLKASIEDSQEHIQNKTEN